MGINNPTTALSNLLLLSIISELITRVVGLIGGDALKESYQGEHLQGNYIAELVAQRINLKLISRTPTTTE